MSYCVNPSCAQPKNPNNVAVCQSCGSQLRLNNRYQPLGILGKGGFGATFGAADISLPGNPICVVKQLRPATDDPQVYKMAKELFEREAETLGKVGNHPQVPRLLDYFEQNKEFYLVQEYVKGYNLHQEVKKKGPFSEAGVKQFLTELLPILEYIHSQKVIHRDIKPANLIRSQKDSKLVLIDFGAVKNQVNSMVANNTQTAFTAFAVGTAGFAPPEQMAMRPVYASDIYAVGVTCVYLLTAKTPKDIGCDPETGEIAWEPYVNISDSLANVLKKMLEVSVKHRYKSAEQVLDAMAMAPYEQGMQDSMTTMITGFKTPSSSSSPNSSLSTGLVSSSPSTRTMGRVNTHISKGSPMSSVSPEDKHSVATKIQGRVAGCGNANYNIAHGQTSSRRRGKGQGISNSDTIATKKNQKKWQEKTLLTAYENGRRDFTNQELNELNLSKAFLPGINCYQAKLSRINLQGAELTRADLGRADLTQAVMKNANLSEAYLGYANLNGADLRGANLCGANLTYANLQGANLCGVDLSSARITEAQLSVAKTNWRTVMPSGKRGFW
ncbi:serine/threonine protein kinase [Crocosphaera subtropica ATCC 51142]|uniref:Serine/threonine-protein kinase B n=1 Tax=Crocosphaera subtropica (strain ATCC 51142 / BH68) TaxID=43989 RepID=B1WVV8_CROS5|nr:serine/threonine-protein kinase [Crocosphaera subtropica]ACB52291.1 serine/threonine protein kinase [Crocosphaera subtropica ATCC 51142]